MAWAFKFCNTYINANHLLVAWKKEKGPTSGFKLLTFELANFRLPGWNLTTLPSCNWWIMTIIHKKKGRKVELVDLHTSLVVMSQWPIAWGRLSWWVHLSLLRKIFISSQLAINCWLIDDRCGEKWFANTASLQWATTDSNGSCFLLEFTQFSHRMTCVPGHVIYSCIFLYAGWVFIIISQLVLTLWLVNLMGSTLLYGWLKFKVVFVAELLVGLLPSVLNFYSK